MLSETLRLREDYAEIMSDKKKEPEVIIEEQS
jgi:hypothetical protein